MGSSARILVMLPSWLGDTVMATPSVRLLRDSVGQSVIVALCKPGLDDLLAGWEALDDVMIADAHGMTGKARLAGRLKAMKFDAALLLPNSFSSAATIRLAGIPLRCGYDRDGRGLLLTHKLDPPRRHHPHKGYAPISAVDYYLRLTRHLLEALGVAPAPVRPRLELAVRDDQEALGMTVLSRGGIGPDEPFALLNPGGNNPLKRWPVERFAAVAHHLIEKHRLKVALNGSPPEADLVLAIRHAIELNHPEDGASIAALPLLGGTVGSLKAIVRRARLVVTNDTGPRHVAAAFGVRCVTLFGPTDPRWTTLPEPVPSRETIFVADPSLPADEIADDHPQRCRIEKIRVSDVTAAIDRLLNA
ncbi:MAG: glycosyltransferase family 9 protein [Phycisphaerae bacterium]|nr:glycosyltransferase family 9 protein [Phycisphaerae bacterium]